MFGLENLGFLGLFIGTFLAATIFPFSSFNTPCTIAAAMTKVSISAMGWAIWMPSTPKAGGSTASAGIRNRPCRPMATRDARKP